MEYLVEEGLEGFWWFIRLYREDLARCWEQCLVYDNNEYIRKFLVIIYLV